MIRLPAWARSAASSAARDSRPSGVSGRVRAASAGKRWPLRTQGCSPAENSSKSKGAGIAPRAQMRRQREIGGLGRAAGENQIASRRPQARRDFSPRGLQQSARRPALGVDRGGVAELVQRRQHRLARSRAQGRGGVIVEIGAGRGHGQAAPLAGQAAGSIPTSARPIIRIRDHRADRRNPLCRPTGAASPRRCRARRAPPASGADASSSRDG